MPLPMVHLSVAEKMIGAGFPIKEQPQFYLGTLSPDAIHMRQDADRLAKNITHLLPAEKEKIHSWEDRNEGYYFEFVRDFINTNQAKASTDFLMGYAIHILTDMLWTKRVFSKFTEKFNMSDIFVQDKLKAYYHDTDIVDYQLCNESDWRSDVWQSLQGVAYSDFLNLLSAQEIKLWNERVLNFYDAPENQYKFSGTPMYITKPDIENFISSCAETISDKMKAAGQA